jgi:uncharacterized protein YcfL
MKNRLIAFLLLPLLLVACKSQQKHNITSGTVQWKDQYSTMAMNHSVNAVAENYPVPELVQKSTHIESSQSIKSGLQEAIAVTKEVASENPDGLSLRGVRKLNKSLKGLSQNVKAEGDNDTWVVIAIVVLVLLTVITLAWLFQKIGLSKGLSWAIVILAILGALFYLAFA